MPGNPGYGVRDRVLVTMLTRTEMTADRLAPLVWPRGDLRTLVAAAGGLLGRMRRDGFLRKQSDKPPVYVLTAKGIARAKASTEKALP